MDNISDCRNKRNAISLVSPVMKLLQDPGQQTDGAIRQTIAKRLGFRALNSRVSTTFSGEPRLMSHPGFLKRRVGMEDILKPENRVLQETRRLGQEGTIEVGRFDMPPTPPNVHDLCEEVTCDMSVSGHHIWNRHTPVSSLGD